MRSSGIHVRELQRFESILHPAGDTGPHVTYKFHVNCTWQPFTRKILNLEPSIPTLGFAPPWRTPHRAWSQHGFQATTPPPIPHQVGYNLVQKFRSTKLPGLLVPYVSMWLFYVRLIKVKHTIVPYSFFASECRVRTLFLLYTHRPPYPTLTNSFVVSSEPLSNIWTLWLLLV